VKDAVDYFDLMRSQFAVMKLAADFKYSETQAEKLGLKQFAFLDTSTCGWQEANVRYCSQRYCDTVYAVVHKTGRSRDDAADTCGRQFRSVKINQLENKYSIGDQLDVKIEKIVPRGFRTRICRGSNRFCSAGGRWRHVACASG
jgi:protein tyrosine phosphatase (PTP) superfamily phosphohydrolase (DUF442 family)